MENIPNVPIRNCGFTARLTNVLVWSGYETTHDVLKTPIQDLLSEMLQWPNCGKKSADELKHWVYSINSLNCSDFKKQTEQLTELYALKAHVNNLIIEKQKQLDAFLVKIDPEIDCYAAQAVSLAKKGHEHDANSLASR